MLGVALSRLAAEFEAVRADSSRTVTRRLEQAKNDYWQAIKALAADRLAEADQSAAAAFLQVEFIRRLLQAEIAERELGEGVMFELDASADEKSLAERIEFDLQQLSVQLYALRQAAYGPAGDS